MNILVIVQGDDCKTAPGARLHIPCNRDDVVERTRLEVCLAGQFCIVKTTPERAVMTGQGQ